MPSFRIALPVFVAVWVACLAAGFGWIYVHSSRPGEPAAPKLLWPRESRLPRTPGISTLVVFAHPHCSCTLATLGELERIQAKAGGKLNAVIAFARPSGFENSWVQGKSWRKAQAGTNVETWIDEDLREAERFGAKTSGQVFLFDSEARLAFQGGITASRGHAGENSGSDAVLDILRSRTTYAHEGTSVYGCSLGNPTRMPSGREP